eukprot:6178023-Pleurochrysis_carterae.AAC.2
MQRELARGCALGSRSRRTAEGSTAACRTASCRLRTWPTPRRESESARASECASACARANGRKLRACGCVRARVDASSVHVCAR